MTKLYLISSLRIDTVRDLANELRELGFDVFDDWHAAGPQADDIWRDYEKQRGRTYLEALQGHHAKHVFALDEKHLAESDVAVLLLPAGKSGHLELGIHLGKGKPGYILLDEPDRWDVMYQFATGVFAEKEKLFSELQGILETRQSRNGSEAADLRDLASKIEEVSRDHPAQSMVSELVQAFSGSLHLKARVIDYQSQLSPRKEDGSAL